MLYAIFFCTIAGLLTASTLARAQMPPEFAGRWGVICAWERCPWSEFQLGDKYRDIKNDDLWWKRLDWRV